MISMLHTSTCFEISESAVTFSELTDRTKRVREFCRTVRRDSAIENTIRQYREAFYPFDQIVLSVYDTAGINIELL